MRHALRHPAVLAWLAAVGVLLGSHIAAAQTAPSGTASAAAATTASATLQQAQASGPGPAAASTPAQPAAVTAGWQNGFFVQSANGDYRLLINGVAQVDGRFSVDDPEPIINTFTVRKLRPSLQGRIAKYIDFRLTPDFGNGTAVLVDAFFDVRFSNALRIRAGKDKTPIGLELLQSDPALLFPERSLASTLVPNRDVGFQALGDLGTKVIYSAGIFNGIPDGANSVADLDTNNGKDLAGRIQLQPFRSASTPASPLNNLGLHLGASSGSQTGALPSFKTSVGQTYFAYAGATADGDRVRVTPGVFYYYKSFGAFGEYVRVQQDVVKGATHLTFTNSGWDVSSVFNLTGEAASSGVVQPRSGFDPPTSKYGALQLVARYAALDVDQDIFTAGFAAAAASQTAKQATIGVNWYPV
ncbi:MAG: porin, partial [Vicinamibacterales bacterium]